MDHAQLLGNNGRDTKITWKQIALGCSRPWSRMHVRGCVKTLVWRCLRAEKKQKCSTQTESEGIYRSFYKAWEHIPSHQLPARQWRLQAGLRHQHSWLRPKAVTHITDLMKWAPESHCWLHGATTLFIKIILLWYTWQKLLHTSHLSYNKNGLIDLSRLFYTAFNETQQFSYCKALHAVSGSLICVAFLTLCSAQFVCTFKQTCNKVLRYLFLLLSQFVRYLLTEICTFWISSWSCVVFAATICILYLLRLAVIHTCCSLN